MMSSLHSERLNLRRFNFSDNAALFELDDDPAVMRFITGGSHTPEDTINKQILPLFIRESDDMDVCGFWAAELKTDGKFIGWFSLRELDGLPGQASLGYRLRREVWGQGLATEGARMLIERGFRVKSLDRIMATTYEENLPSIAVMRRLGMRFARAYQLSADELVNTDTSAQDPDTLFPGKDVEYSIARSDWSGL